MILFRNTESKSWETIFDAGKLIRKSGDKFSREQINKAISSPGDGVVAKSSLLYGAAKDVRVTMVCSDHNRLMGNREIEKDLLQILNSSDASAGH